MSGFARLFSSSRIGSAKTAPGRSTWSTPTMPCSTLVRSSAPRAGGSPCTRYESSVGLIDKSGHKWLDMAMRRVGVAELKNNLSKNLRLVQDGEVIEVTDHDRAIARLVPIEAKTRVVIRPAAR